MPVRCRCAIPVRAHPCVTHPSGRGEPRLCRRKQVRDRPPDLGQVAPCQGSEVFAVALRLCHSRPGQAGGGEGAALRGAGAILPQPVARNNSLVSPGTPRALPGHSPGTPWALPGTPGREPLFGACWRRGRGQCHCAGLLRGSSPTAKAAGPALLCAGCAPSSFIREALSRIDAPRRAPLNAGAASSCACGGRSAGLSIVASPPMPGA